MTFYLAKVALKVQMTVQDFLVYLCFNSNKKSSYSCCVFVFLLLQNDPEVEQVCAPFKIRAQSYTVPKWLPWEVTEKLGAIQTSKHSQVGP